MKTKHIIIGIIVILALLLAMKVAHKIKHKHDKGDNYKKTEQVEIINTNNTKNENTMNTQEQTNSNVDAGVIEIATFELGEGVSPEDFAPIDQAVENEHVSQQAGFISRNTGISGNEWMVIVHWEDEASAQASMDSFSTAPAAEGFMSNMNVETMKMIRYNADGYSFGDEKATGVVELATFQLAGGVSAEDFTPVSQLVEDQHVSQQPGFIARDTGVSDSGWLAMVHWEDEASAQASMASFSSAPIAADFVSKINLETMVAKTYTLND